MVEVDSVVVDDLHFGRPRHGPPEADSVLVVDSNAVLALPIVCEGIEAITGWDSQDLDAFDRIQLIELATRDPPNVSRAGLARRARVLAVEDVRCPSVRKRLDHSDTIARTPCYR